MTPLISRNQFFRVNDRQLSTVNQNKNQSGSSIFPEQEADPEEGSSVLGYDEGEQEKNTSSQKSDE